MINFNNYYQKIIVNYNLEEKLLFFYKIYLYLLSIKNFIFLHLKIETSFSSFYQDKWILKKIFNEKKGGYFIDVGAYDGVSNNNTILFEKYYNWNGCCIEPVKEFFLSLKKNRKCKLINAAVSNTKVKKVKFYKTGQLSRIVNSKDKTKKIQMVKNYKLEKFQRNIVDLIDIDCEGFEESVIKSINFKKTIKCILLERPNYEVHKILKKNNFIFVKRYLFDYIYINKKYFNNFKEKKYQPLPNRTFLN